MSETFTHDSRWRRVYRRATDECESSTTGHWDSGNPAFTISRRRCGTMPYTSSDISRFPVMLLFPILSDSGKTGRLRVICLELWPPPGAIHSVRTMAHSFPSLRFPSWQPSGTSIRWRVHAVMARERGVWILADFRLRPLDSPHVSSCNDCSPSPCTGLSPARTPTTALPREGHFSCSAPRRF